MEESKKEQILKAWEQLEKIITKGKLQLIIKNPQGWYTITDDEDKDLIKNIDWLHDELFS